MGEDDAVPSVLRALDSPARRQILDRLRERGGQSLAELTAGSGMARQSVDQHVGLLVDAGLVSVARQGRQRLHFLNPEPIHRLQERWISAFDAPRLDTLARIRHAAEESAMSQTPRELTPAYVYVTYIRATPEQVWHALTDADVTAAYWRHRNTSSWNAGDTWRHETLDEAKVDVIGTVLDAQPPHRLRITFDSPEDFPSATASIVTFTLEAGEGITRLRVEHRGLPDRTAAEEVAHGWPAVLANLKTFLETGAPLPQDPWAMPPATTQER